MNSVVDYGNQGNEGCQPNHPHKQPTTTYPHHPSPTIHMDMLMTVLIMLMTLKSFVNFKVYLMTILIFTLSLSLSRSLSNACYYCLCLLLCFFFCHKQKKLNTSSPLLSTPLLRIHRFALRDICVLAMEQSYFIPPSSRLCVAIVNVAASSPSAAIRRYSACVLLFLRLCCCCCYCRWISSWCEWKLVHHADNNVVVATWYIHMKIFLLFASANDSKGNNNKSSNRNNNK